jgi:ribosomal-protein-alanine N-acetyltransferase
MRINGAWPNPIVLRRGWARADARPWNRSRPDAHLRLIRGSSAFLADATETVLTLGAESVISPPLTAGSQEPWRRAGFSSYASLRLLRKQVGGEEPTASVTHHISDRDWPRVVSIDAAAFGPMWKAELPALAEALRSSSTSTVLGVDQDGDLAGYAIIAASGGVGYLQRIAVHPDNQRRGLGRTLIRSAHNWTRRRGARHIILNTKPDNRGALALYESEGYTPLPDRLELLRYPGTR